MRPRQSSFRGIRAARAGFSFVEVLVVIAIIAVLASIGVAVYLLAFQKSDEFKTRTLLQTANRDIEAFKSRFGAYPPSNITRLPLVMGTTNQIGKPTPANTTNMGSETMYQAFVAPGLNINPNLDNDRCNTDGDALDVAFDPDGNSNLYEVKDLQGNPLVYIPEGEYRAFEKEPPTYVDRDGKEFHPRPFRTKEGDFAQRHGYQLFSIGKDGVPNTDDDVKAWE